MITNGNKCKYRYKYGWFIFSKFQCDIAIPGKKWIGQASKGVCNICRVNEYEVTYDCIHYRIGTEKLYSDKNEVIVRGFCFFEFKDAKDFRNEIKYDNCGPNKCPHKAYTKRPIFEPIKPAIQEEKTVTKTAPASIIPLGLKIWTILPTLPITIFAILLSIRNAPRYLNETSLVVLGSAILIFLLRKFALKGTKWAFSLYRTLAGWAGIIWVFSLFEHVVIKRLANIRNVEEEIVLFICIITGIMISFIVAFNKLGRVEEKIYGAKQKRKLYPIFIGGIIISSLIFANLSKEKSFLISLLRQKAPPVAKKLPPPPRSKGDIRFPPAPAPAPAPAAPTEPAPAPDSPAVSKSPSTSAPSSDSTNALVTEKKKNIERLLKLGEDLYMRYNDYEKAIEKFENVLEIDPKNLRALIGKGKILHDLGIYQKAIESYQEALRIDQRSQDALTGIERAKSASEAEEKVLRR